MRTCRPRPTTLSRRQSGHPRNLRPIGRAGPGPRDSAKSFGPRSSPRCGPSSFSIDWVVRPVPCVRRYLPVASHERALSAPSCRKDLDAARAIDRPDRRGALADAAGEADAVAVECKNRLGVIATGRPSFQSSGRLMRSTGAPRNTHAIGCAVVAGPRHFVSVCRHCECGQARYGTGDRPGFKGCEVNKTDSALGRSHHQESGSRY